VSWGGKISYLKGIMLCDFIFSTLKSLIIQNI
jgi:hypothetical protein